MSTGDAQSLVASLHNLEVKYLRAFRERRNYAASELAVAAGLDEASGRRAAEWLQTKGAIEIASEEVVRFIKLSEAGLRYTREGTPERRMYDYLTSRGRVTMDELKSLPGLSPDEIGPAIGAFRSAQLMKVGDDGSATVGPGDKGVLEKVEVLMTRVSQAGRLPLTDLSADDANLATKGARKRGQSRGPFDVEEETRRAYRLTALGESLLALAVERGMTGDEVSRLTPDMIRSGAWKNVKFRRYDLSIRPPKGVVGRKHPYRQFLDHVKYKLVAMGFEEMSGSLVETEFWNMDALYMPQFHSAREIHDVYFVKEPQKARELPEPFGRRVVAAHENGGGTGSTGWGYRMDIERARRLVLRSQGTALSAQQLAAGAKVPGKYFAIARCFRYDTVDATHAADFFQIEGIVVGAGTNFRNLLGLLKLFALEIAGAKELKFTPAYFPFTEPSVEIHMRHPEIGWMELGGAGMFRPEVTYPLGVEAPVIAWGLGLDRMAMVALQINDIRDLFSPDLEFIRSRRVGKGMA